MNKCVFCKIAAGELPSHKVYEDDLVMAFLDIAGWTKGHTVIIPKGHHADLLDTPDELVAKIAVLAKDLATNYKPTLGAAGFNVLNNCGEAGEQEILHYHVLLIPRYTGEEFRMTVKNAIKDEDLARTAADLRND